MTLLMAVLVWGSAAEAAQDKTPVPDFTRGDGRRDSHDWTLGPTGARGWMDTRAGRSAEARQILVTAVAKGSPADGVLAKDDVIVGVGGRPFDNDARIAFARAVAAAEADSGVLALRVWRKGATRPAELRLPVLGRYAETAPYDCPKSKRVFELGCEALARAPLGSPSIPNDLNALALLASGKPDYRPLLAEYAQKVADYRADGFASWYYGYATLFLAEYAAVTRDPAVTDGLRRLCREIALGASGVGTWGHKFARPDGNCNGYGAMNSPGIVLLTALAVAREAGVKDPDVERVLAKGAAFLRWYVDKGAIPYGDHLPWPGHEDNGKCSGAAILFDLLGDREAADFFTRMSAAAYDERERGHTGNFFNVLWALPGVSRGGPLLTGAYWKEQAWYYDLARGWDGRFAYQGSPEGEEEHKKYTNWDSTGAYLLSYALPLKSLLITGRKPSSVPPLAAAEVKDVVEAGRDYFTSKKGYEGRSVERLLGGLSSWSPAVRRRSALGLAKAEGDPVPALLKLLAGASKYGRYGACLALGHLGPRADAAAPALRALLQDPDPWMRSLAAKAIPALGPAARKEAVGDLLRMAAAEDPADPRRMAHRAAAEGLFSPYPGSGGPKSLLSDTLDGIDRTLLHPAIRSVLVNEDGAARGSLSRIYGKLSERDVAVLMPSILEAIRTLAPSNEMFGDGIRLAGLDLVSKLRLREGMELCVALIEPDRWGQGNRLPKCLEALKRYGAHAKAMLFRLQEVRRELVGGNKRNETSDNVKLLDKAMAEIEASKDMPSLRDLKDLTAVEAPGR